MFKLLDKRITFIGLVGILATTGCMHYKHRGGIMQDARNNKIEFVHSYEKASSFNFNIEGVREHSNYRIERIKLSPILSCGDANTNILDFYIPSGKKKAPTILVLPILGGNKYTIEEHFASYFAKNEYVSVIVHRESFKNEVNKLGDVDKMLKQTTIEHQRVLD